MDINIMQVGESTPVNVGFIVATSDEKTLLGGGVGVDVEIAKQIRILLSSYLKRHSRNKDIKVYEHVPYGKTNGEIILEITSKCDFIIIFASNWLLNDDGYFLLMDAIFSVNIGKTKRIRCVYVICQDIDTSHLVQPETGEKIIILPANQNSIYNNSEKEIADIIRSVSYFLSQLIEAYRSDMKLVAMERQLEEMKNKLELTEHQLSIIRKKVEHEKDGQKRL